MDTGTLLEEGYLPLGMTRAWPSVSGGMGMNAYLSRWAGVCFAKQGVCDAGYVR